MSELLKYIKLGTDCVEYFNYDGQALPIRPLSTYEHDNAIMSSIKGVSPLVFDSVIKVKIGLIDKDEELNLEPSVYSDFLRYYNEIDYWTVFYGMKDFQPEEFSMPDYEGKFKDDFDDWESEKPKGYYIVRKMKLVHDISKKIQMMTDQPDTQLVEIITNNEGKLLGKTIHNLNVPLNDKAWKLTPLQTKFLLFTRPGAPTVVKSKEDLPGIKGGTFEEIAKQLGEMGFGNG